MLTPRYLEDLPAALIELYSTVEQDILADMARRIAKTGLFTDAAKWQYRKARELGNFHGYILQALSALTGKSRQEIQRLFEEAGTKALAFDDEIYRRAGKGARPIAESPALQSVIEEGIKKTGGLFKNLTGTIADTATKQFEDALDRAWLQAVSGAFTPQQAIRSAVKALAAAGLQSAVYPSGHRDHMDVAIRRATVTGINQTCARLQLTRADEMGCDLLQVTSHLGARPSHAEWQGEILSRSGKHPRYRSFEIARYGEGGGLCGWNCRHSFFPFYEGLSADTYERYGKEGNNTEGNNKVYEQTQRQRAFERRIRKSKRACTAFDAASLTDDFIRAAALLKRQEQELRDFLKTTQLYRRKNREQAPGFGRSQSSKAVWAAKNIPKKAVSRMVDL